MNKWLALLKRETVTIVVATLFVAGAWAVYALPGIGTPPTQASAQSIVGTQPYDGPDTGREVQAACRASADVQSCWTATLNDLLDGRGAGIAFDALDGLTTVDPAAYHQGHAMAHGLGRHAFYAYGDVELTLANCSYKVFGGCFHGALQSYFDSLGRPVKARDIESLCPTSPPFAQYTCLHGLGHGLMLNTNYALNRSLELCDALDTWFAQSSCQGGVFMENWVGYIDSLTPTPAGGHDHHGSSHATPSFFVDPEDPTYPCSMAQDQHQGACWLLQTSVMLHFNGFNFTHAAHTCAGIAQVHQDTCFRSLGRDVSPFVNRNMTAAAPYCSSEPAGAQACMKGVLAELLLNAANPSEGLAACHWAPEDFKASCYEELGWQVAGMIGRKEAEQVCVRADHQYASYCYRAANLTYQ